MKSVEGLTTFAAVMPWMGTLMVQIEIAPKVRTFDYISLISHYDIETNTSF